jgi:hypothetical protein
MTSGTVLKCCRNADAEMPQMSNGKNAKIVLIFPGIPAFHHLQIARNCPTYIFKLLLPDLFFRNPCIFSLNFRLV